MVDFRELVRAGVHFGHQKSRWCPKMSPYIWGSKNNIHLIDVSITAFQLEKASKFLESVAAEGKTILWIGTKKAAQKAVLDVSTSVNMPYINHRWIGGTLSNFSQVKKSLTRLLHYEDVLEKSEKFPHYTKKELSGFRKVVERLVKNVGGIRKLSLPVGAIVLVDVNKEQSAILEAVSMGVPVVAIVDTNADPSLVDYVIPANDDSPQAIDLIMKYLGTAVNLGKEAAVKKAKEEEAKRIAEKALKAAEKEVSEGGATPVKEKKAAAGDSSDKKKVTTKGEAAVKESSVPASKEKLDTPSE